MAKVKELPDPFRFDDCSRVASRDDWRRRREEIRLALLAVQYGSLPPSPTSVRGELLMSQPARYVRGARHSMIRLHVSESPPFWFLVDLLVPPAGEGLCPVVITGDACWGYVADPIAIAVLGRGYVLAQWNRAELVPDLPVGRDIGLYRLFPGLDFGALAAWAWGYHRVVDYLAAQPFVDPARIAVVGHSRGGKTSLLAGATDERIALTSANDSGCGGAGCYRFQGPGSETLGDILRAFPYWFAPGLASFVGREDELPFDQHSLKALVAPRPLLTTEALGDLWANPSGSYLTHLAAREVYRFLGAEERIGIWYRKGGHEHGLADWEALLDIADLRLRGGPPVHTQQPAPFADLPIGHTWKAPRPSA